MLSHDLFQYAVRSQAKMRSYGENAVMEIAPRQGEHTLRNNDILKVRLFRFLEIQLQSINKHLCILLKLFIN